MNRPCLVCGKLIPSGSRCILHQGEHVAAKRLKYGGDWRPRSRAARVAAGRCAWCGTTQDLTLDHATGLVLCRRENSAQGGRGI